MRYGGQVDLAQPLTFPVWQCRAAFWTGQIVRDPFFVLKACNARPVA